MGIWVPSLIRGCRNVALALLLLGCGANVTGSVGADATATDLGADAVISAEDVPRNDTSRDAAVDPAVPGRECMVAADCPRFSGSLACEVGYCVGRSGGREWRLCESGRYVSVLDDPAHCGRCNNPCGILETCAGRVCVPCVDGTGRCEVSVNRCGINLRADPSHCGACGRRCSDEERCVVGTCTPCPTGMGRCGATNCATALSTNRLHCGACNRRCADDEVCTAGVCVRCPEGSDRCETSMCFDLQSDARHCGGCFQACPDGSPCVGGVCQRCPAGSGRCGGSVCRDLSADPMNCGACGAECPGARTPRTVGFACIGGRCVVTACVSGTAECDGDPGTPCETALAVSDAHCGACGRACGRGQRCIRGACTAVPLRQRAPISATSVTSRRPTFWWFLEPGVTGARVQLCTRRDCATVTATWDASGDHLRAPTELPVGVHFWRLFARRGDAVDPTPGLLWEFEVPSTPQRIRGYGAEGMHAIGDVNGDGDGDAATVQGVAYGTGAGFVPAAGPIFVPPSSWMAYSATFRASSVGDLDGDGLGDHVTWRTEVFLAPDPHHLTAGSLRLGAGGTTLIPWPQRQAVAWAWGDVRGEGRTRFFTLLLESAGTSTLEESGPGAGALVRVANCVTATAAMTLDAADFDGDGDDDLRARYSPTIVGSANGGPAGLGTWTCGP